MDLSLWVAIASLIVSVPQGYAAILQLSNSKKRRGTIASLLFGVTFALIGFSVWLLVSDPLKPKVIERIVEKTSYVEKPVPCPITQSGPATTHGTNSPANSGNGRFSYDIPNSAPKPHKDE